MTELYEKVKRFLLERGHSYRTTFKGPVAEVVLRDLAKFCHACESTFDPDARIHAGYEGRREVWLRIQDHLHLPPEKLMELYHGDR